MSYHTDSSPTPCPCTPQHADTPRSGNKFMDSGAWSNTGACAMNNPQDLPIVNCDLINDGILQAEFCPGKCSHVCDEMTQYCDCGSEACEYKPGFTNAGVGLCSAARCGTHGKCVAQYLGGDIPVTSNACICNDGWSGELCQFNPCLGKSCSGHGKCTATSDQDAKCLCDDGFSGESCQNSCDGICQGSFPYGCAPQVAGAVKLGCTKDGHCNYLNYGEQYPWPGFCTYKEALTQSNCLCGSENDCEVALSCSSNGSCPAPQYLTDATPCNSVPFGTCQSGICVGPSPVSAPTTKPIQQVRSYFEIVVGINVTSSYPFLARYQFDPQL